VCVWYVGASLGDDFPLLVVRLYLCYQGGGTCDTVFLSPPASGSSWTDWSHAWGGEMHLKRALEKLNLEYPHDPGN